MEFFVIISHATCPGSARTQSIATLSTHGTKQKPVYNIQSVCFSERSYNVRYELLTFNRGRLCRKLFFCHGILYCVIGPSKDKIGTVANTLRVSCGRLCHSESLSLQQSLTRGREVARFFSHNIVNDL
jgi:hypothetical protein